MIAWWWLIVAGVAGIVIGAAMVIAYLLDATGAFDG